MFNLLNMHAAQYGAERLAETRRTEGVRDRHVTYFLTMAEGAASELTTSKQVMWLDRLESDYDNFRAAMTWALESDQGETALRVASALFWFWIFHRHVNDGQDLIERAVLLSGDASPQVRAIGLAKAAVLHAKKQKDFERLNGWLAESLRLCQEAGWTEVKTQVLFLAGVVAWFEGELERASEYLDEVQPFLDHNELTWFMSATRRFQGSVAASRGDDQQATDLLEQSLALARKAGDHFFTGYVLIVLGAHALDQGAYQRAEALYGESLPMFRDLNDITGVACVFAGLGNVAWLQGDHEKTLRLHQEALANFRDSREGSSIAWCLACLAGVAHAPGRLPRLVERHNERLDLPPEVWSKEVVAETLHRVGTAAERQGDLERATALLQESQALAHEIRDQQFTSPASSTQKPRAIKG